MESCLSQSCATAASGTSSMIFTQLIQTLLIAQCSLTQPFDYPPDRTHEILSNSQVNYDFVIVGGGSAGSVIANRLSENGDWKILLIEAGENPSIMSEVPALLLYLQGTTEDYSYDAEPQKNVCQSMIGKRCKWAKGKALGGSSVINAMLHVHGNKRDYDEWSNHGNSGWSYDEILPYFKKSENYDHTVVNKLGEKYVGTGGPLTLRNYNYTESVMHEIIMNAVEERGIPIIENFNGDRYIGFGKAHGTIDNGVRNNVAKAFLSPIKDRKNLYVMRSARADKIIVENGRAKSVVVTLGNGKIVTIVASKEIIVSAGSVETPKLLMLSGIGPKNHLTEFNIDTIADLPVGRNLRDHVTWLGIQLEFINTTLKTMNERTFLLDEAYNYLVHKTGELTSIGGIDLLGFVSLNDEKSEYPDVQYHHTYVPRGQTFKIQGLMQAFGMDENFTDNQIKFNRDKDVIFMCPVVLKPRSIGEIKLRSNDPSVSPKIIANYLDEKYDVETFMKSLDFVKTLLNTKTFENYGIKLRHVPIDGCESTVPDSRDYWECSLRHTAGTIYHPVGTAKMGNSDDPESVVDETLKVRGVRGLRVIDASIMPDIPSGNIHSPTLMIAEKGSDMIKREWMTKDEL